jgi:hypothetical protein
MDFFAATENAKPIPAVLETTTLPEEIRSLIESVRRRAATTINSDQRSTKGHSQLYWQFRSTGETSRNWGVCAMDARKSLLVSIVCMDFLRIDD